MSFVSRGTILLGIGVMSFAGRYVYNTIFRPQQETPENREYSGLYEPSIEDVFSVKTILSGNFELPLELVDTIIDHAEYWPHTSVIRTGEALTVQAGAGHENQFLVSRQTTIF